MANDQICLPKCLIDKISSHLCDVNIFLGHTEIANKNLELVQELIRFRAGVTGIVKPVEPDVGSFSDDGDTPNIPSDSSCIIIDEKINFGKPLSYLLVFVRIVTTTSAPNWLLISKDNQIQPVGGQQRSNVQAEMSDETEIEETENEADAELDRKQLNFVEQIGKESDTSSAVLDVDRDLISDSNSTICDSNSTSDSLSEGSDWNKIEPEPLSPENNLELRRRKATYKQNEPAIEKSSFKKRRLTTLARSERTIGNVAERDILVLVDRFTRLLRSKRGRCSATFFCKDLKWIVKVFGAKNNFDVFLECINFRQSDVLAANVSAEIKLMANNSDDQNVMKKMNFQVSCNDINHGIKGFHSFMMNSPFVRNDAIKLSISLKVLKIIRHL